MMTKVKGYKNMSVKKIILLVGLCVLFAGCSTGRYGDDLLGSSSYSSTTEMGARYLLGRGVVQSDEKAFSYFSQAAEESDDPFAENELAYMYASGRGTTKDYAKALSYYQRAANHDLASAQYNLGMMYLHGLGTARNQALGLKWLQKSAQHGFEPAKQALSQNNISVM